MSSPSTIGNVMGALVVRIVVVSPPANARR